MKTFVFADENIVISRIDSVYRTRVYGKEGYRDRYMDIIVILNGRELREGFYCGYEPFSNSPAHEMELFVRSKNAAIAKARAREKEIIGFIDKGCAQKRTSKKKTKE